MTEHCAAGLPVIEIWAPDSFPVPELLDKLHSLAKPPMLDQINALAKKHGVTHIFIGLH
jgi:hypothetical protein